MNLDARSVLENAPKAGVPLAVSSRPGLDLVERTEMGCVLCTAAVDPSGVAEALGATIALSTDPGAVVQQGERYALWFSPCSWLILCPLSDEEVLISAVQAAAADHSVLASRYSDHFCWIELSGERTEDALRQGGFITFRAEGLPEQYAKRTLIAGIRVLIYSIEKTRWLLGIERSRAWYFFDWLNSL